MNIALCRFYVKKYVFQNRAPLSKNLKSGKDKHLSAARRLPVSYTTVGPVPTGVRDPQVHDPQLCTTHSYILKQHNKHREHHEQLAKVTKGWVYHPQGIR